MLPWSVRWTSSTEFHCDACISGKAHESRIPKFVGSTTTREGELVHSDVWGPSQVPSVGGKRYFVTFIDDFTRAVRAVPIAAKSDVSTVFEHFLQERLTQTGSMYQRVRSDNGGEYHASFTSVCKKFGLKQEFTTPYSPWQNGVSERMNRTLVEGVRTLLVDASLPKKYWSVALMYFQSLYSSEEIFQMPDKASHSSFEMNQLQLGPGSSTIGSSLNMGEVRVVERENDDSPRVAIGSRMTRFISSFRHP